MITILVCPWGLKPSNNGRGLGDEKGREIKEARCRRTTLDALLYCFLCDFQILNFVSGGRYVLLSCYIFSIDKMIPTHVCQFGLQVNFYIRGPHGHGKVFCEMFKGPDNEWKFTYLIVEIRAPSPAQLILESYIPSYSANK